MIFPKTSLTLSGERFIVHYRLAAGDEAQALETARGICLEQTVEVPMELLAEDDIRGQVVGRIEAVAAAGPGGADSQLSGLAGHGGHQP